MEKDKQMNELLGNIAFYSHLINYPENLLKILKYAPMEHRRILHYPWIASLDLGYGSE